MHDSDDSSYSSSGEEQPAITQTSAAAARAVTRKHTQKHKHVHADGGYSYSNSDDEEETEVLPHSVANRGTSAPHGSARARLERFYRRYNPEKLSTIDETLATFKGHEAHLFRRLRETAKDEAETGGMEPEP